MASGSYGRGHSMPIAPPLSAHRSAQLAAALPALRTALARASEPLVAEWVARTGAEGDAILATYGTRQVHLPTVGGLSLPDTTQAFSPPAWGQPP